MPLLGLVGHRCSSLLDVCSNMTNTSTLNLGFRFERATSIRIQYSTPTKCHVKGERSTRFQKWANMSSSVRKWLGHGMKSYFLQTACHPSAVATASICVSAWKQRYICGVRKGKPGRLPSTTHAPSSAYVFVHAMFVRECLGPLSQGKPNATRRIVNRLPARATAKQSASRLPRLRLCRREAYHPP